jgi:hypothetical protein
MQQTANSQQRNFHYPVAETLWVLAGIVLLLAYGDALVLLAVASAIVAVAAAWWIRDRRVARTAATINVLASVTQLNPPSTRRAELKATSPRAPWRGPTAA